MNAWYGKFVNDNSRKNEKVKVIDVTVPLQCLVKDSKLILTEASKVHSFSVKAQTQELECVTQHFDAVLPGDFSNVLEARDSRFIYRTRLHSEC